MSGNLYFEKNNYQKELYRIKSAVNRIKLYIYIYI